MTAGSGAPAARLKTQVRLMRGEDIALGPGKAQLLAAIAAHGSISAAGRELGMSYRRAWALVETMNRCFREPLVQSAAGGLHGGGAHLSPLGEQVLTLYLDMKRAVECEAAAFEGALTGLLRQPADPPLDDA